MEKENLEEGVNKILSAGDLIVDKWNDRKK